MTIAIASYQRRLPLARLLDGLAAQIVEAPQLAGGLEVVVVLDGSTDGSLEHVQSRDFPVPLTAQWQPNRGLAATRNAGLAAARGDLVWFLDDDLVPGQGLVARHRGSHREGRQHVLMGPCHIPPSAATLPEIRASYDGQYAELERTGAVRYFDQFSAANTSGAAEVFRRVGGFDEDFVEYGMEDYELGFRLLEAAVPILFDPVAVAVHDQERTIAQLCAITRSEGRNRVRLVSLHPGTFDYVFPRRRTGRKGRMLSALRPWAPLSYRLVAGVAATGVRLVPARRRQLLALAVTASRLAGVAEADSDGRFLTRELGDRRPSSREPA